MEVCTGASLAAPPSETASSSSGYNSVSSEDLSFEELTLSLLLSLDFVGEPGDWLVSSVGEGGEWSSVGSVLREGGTGGEETVMEGEGVKGEVGGDCVV